MCRFRVTAGCFSITFQVARSAKDNERYIYIYLTRRRELGFGPAKPHAARDRRIAPKETERSGKRFVSVQISDRPYGIDRTHVFLFSAVPVFPRSGGRSANRDRTATQLERLPASLPLPSPSSPPPPPLLAAPDLRLRFLLPRMNDRLLSFSVRMHASFFFRCPSTAPAPIT
ncbi:hypothetical protein P5V15_007523 [Pogonomyrmex californicus]